MSKTLNEMRADLDIYGDLLNKVHHIDCFDFMKQIPDNYFDLILTDPPYGINVANTMHKQAVRNMVRQAHPKGITRRATGT